MSITARRLAPFLIAATLATGGVALTTTAAHAAPSRPATRVATDDDNPFFDALRTFGNLSRTNHDAAGGDSAPPAWGDGQNAGGGDSRPPTGGAGGGDHVPGDGIFGGSGGSHDADTAPTDVTRTSDGGVVHGGESRSGDARPGPVFQR
ncbi:hypothetical protein ABT403_23805 [Streptomyces sp. NPDC000075]